MSDEYFLWVDEIRQGPFTIEQIVDKIDLGLIDMSTLMARNTSRFTSTQDWILYIDEARRNIALAPRPPLKPEQKRRRKMAVLVGSLIAFGILALISLFSSRTAMSAYHHLVQDRDAYRIARKFVECSFPEARIFSNQEPSVIKPEGNTWDVAFVVDRKNGFGSPIRKAVIVSMYKRGDRWTCEGIHPE